MYPVGDKEPCLFNLEEFDSDKSAFGNKLKLTTHSRGLFVKVYNLCRGNEIKLLICLIVYICFENMYTVKSLLNAHAQKKVHPPIWTLNKGILNIDNSGQNASL